MKINQTKLSSNSDIPLNIFSEIIQGWKFWLPAAIFSFFFASILMSGWPDGLIPNVTYPYFKGGDAEFANWGVQRLIEGWIFNNPRSGYPFGSPFFDYPSSDAGGFAILKILGTLSGEYYVALNLFFLLSFPLIAVTSFASFRALNLNSWFSSSACLIYTFAPFHFLKAGHIFYTWYFVVPIFFYAAFKIFYFQKSTENKQIYYKGIILLAVILFISSSFGVYYALFGTIVIGIGGIAGALSHKSYNNFTLSLAAIAIITFGVIANVSPNLINNSIEGKNPEAVSRSMYGAEIYGFKIVQLLLPRQDHRFEPLSKKAGFYNSSTPLVNENVASSLGIVGSLGLVILAGVLAQSLSGKVIDSRLGLLALIGIILILFGTIGGLGSVFSMLATPLIRGWNRISIFISYAAIAAFFIALQIFIEQRHRFWKIKFVTPVIAFALIIFSIYDQTTWACKSCNLALQTSFKIEKGFIDDLENLLPKGSAIYQLPYMYFPENPGLHRLPDYEHAIGFSNSKDLHWSYGGIKGRKGDNFFRTLAKEPIKKQVEVIQNLGFNAIYIDRRGFADNANAVLSELKIMVGDPIATRKDGEIVVFQVTPTNTSSLKNLTFDQIVEKSQFTIHGIQTQYKATLQEGIDFKKEGYPSFLKSVSGIDAHENWGRWSNASLAQSVRLVFNEPLPKKFTIELKAIGYGPNINAKTKIQVGDITKTILLQADASQLHELEFDNLSGANSIEIFPPKPTSPNQLSLTNTDVRKIGIGLISLKIIPTR
jgi:phosphoglycerol transferase